MTSWKKVLSETRFGVIFHYHLSRNFLDIENHIYFYIYSRIVLNINGIILPIPLFQYYFFFSTIIHVSQILLGIGYV